MNKVALRITEQNYTDKEYPINENDRVKVEKTISGMYDKLFTGFDKAYETFCDESSRDCKIYPNVAGGEPIKEKWVDAWTYRIINNI